MPGAKFAPFGASWNLDCGRMLAMAGIAALALQTQNLASGVCLLDDKSHTHAFCLVFLLW